jgi:hypothetical protein
MRVTTLSDQFTLAYYVSNSLSLKRLASLYCHAQFLNELLPLKAANMPHLKSLITADVPLGTPTWLSIFPGCMCRALKADSQMLPPED